MDQVDNVIEAMKIRIIICEPILILHLPKEERKEGLEICLGIHN
jgi:hypothetical protein